MSNTNLDKPLEGLLRPPIEWYTTGAALLLAISLKMFPEYFLIPNDMFSWVCLGLIIFAAWRFWQGLRVVRYQKNLKRMSTYTVSSKTLPVKKQQVFLGKGFEWTPIHTQRLRDLDLAYNQEYVRPAAWKAWARRKEIQWADSRFLHPLVNFLKKDVWWNPFRPYPAIGGYPHLHGVSLKEHEVYMNLVDRGHHMIVVGLTGVGKTRFAEIMIGQDIRRGDVVIVLDPKGDKELLRRVIMEAKIAGRENDLRVIHLGFVKESCRYNPIGSFTKQTQVATRVANALPSTGEAAAFKEFAWKYVNMVVRGLEILELRPTYKLLNFYITKLDVLFTVVLQILLKKDSALAEAFEQFKLRQLELIKKKTLKRLAESNNPPKDIEDTARTLAQAQLSSENATTQLLRFAEDHIESLGHELVQDDIVLQLINDLMAACRLDRTYYDKITASVGPLLEKLTSGQLANLLSPDYEDFNDNRPILDWIQVFRQNQIVYVGMDALTDPIISSVVGNAMLSDLTATAGYLYKFGLLDGFPSDENRSHEVLPSVKLHADEFNENIGDEFIPLLNKSRGAGFAVTAYTQTWSDVEARLNSAAKAGQVAGNLGALVMFRCKDKKTVDQLLSQLPKVPILRPLPASSSSDTPHGAEGVYFQSSNEDRLSYQDVPLIEQSDISNLPKGQAFVLLEGGKLFKVRLPLPVAEESENDPVANAHSVETLLQQLPYLDQKKSEPT
jgi:conjugative coupling factor TraD (TOL family)